MSLATDGLELDNLSADPSSPADGRVWYNSANQIFRVRNSAHRTAQWGDGSDGAVTLSSNTTLTKDMLYDSLTVGSYTLNANGFRIFVKNKLSIAASGVVHNDGSNASGSSAGAGAPDGTTLGGGTGGAGSTTNTANNGGSKSNSLGGAGGAGGGNGTQAGGTGGTVTAAAANYGRLRSNPMSGIGHFIGAGSSNPVSVTGGGGGGGGCGKNGGNGTGGGGGGAGGSLAISARIIDNAGTIRVNGGNGAAGQAGEAGGGAGGGGGTLILNYGLLTTTGTIQANGGTAGAGIGAGAAGAAGAAGNIIQVEG